MRLSRLSLLIFAAGCGVLPRQSGPAPSGAVPRVGAKALRRAIDSVTNSPEFSNGYWGVLVVTAAGDTLYSRNAGKLFMPASNQKLLTSAVALAQLGPDYRYRTVLVAHAVVADGVLEGDLGVIGRGDPSVSDHMRHDAMIPLREIADSVSAHGIRRIRGKLVAEGNAFPEPVLGYGWSWDDLESDYSAATDELLFNEGFSTVIIRAGHAPGDSVQIETRPTRTWPRLRASVTTVTPPPAARDSTALIPRPRVVVTKDTVTGEVIVTGTIAAGDSVIEAVTHRDPDAAYIAALREALIDKGIGIGDEAVSGAPPSDTVAVFFSPPLSDILPIFLKPSQNQIGEMLFKTLGLERGTVGTTNAGRHVIEAQLKAWGARDDGYVVRDGSGLSRYDYVSPETIVHVLDAMRRARTFPLFYQSLPIAGIDGTIENRMRGTPAENNVHAKTGSVAQARSLSGYVRALDGDTLMFSVLANNWSVPAGRVTAAADSIAARLASYRRR
jgi:serine-type D-Ala-D-Ala carboxypeptidase/endopeptidase (penicillin-binding protein 4)